MTPLNASLGYMARGWPVFPCQWRGQYRKRPLVGGGFHAASTDEAQIREWWRHWPEALIGVATGDASGVVVLDIDVKQPEANGYDTLDDLGFAILPSTPMVHTGSGGLHTYFVPPENVEIRCTGGDKGRGIGPGLDWRGNGGYVIAPAPRSGYEWDPIWNLNTVPFAPVPAALLPRAPDRPATMRPVEPTTGLSPYAEAALDNACQRIIGAPAGEQEATLNGEAFAIGTLAGAGAVPADFARQVLLWAGRQISDHDHRRPWRAREVQYKIDRAFHDGIGHPRAARHA